MSEYKFKVGDKVRCTDISGSENELYYGHVYSVVDTYYSPVIDKVLIVLKGIGAAWLEDRFELIKSEDTLQETPNDIEVTCNRTYTLKVKGHTFSLTQEEFLYLYGKIEEAS